MSLGLKFYIYIYLSDFPTFVNSKVFYDRNLVEPTSSKFFVFVFLVKKKIKTPKILFKPMENL